MILERHPSVLAAIDERSRTLNLDKQILAAGVEGAGAIDAAVLTPYGVNLIAHALAAVSVVSRERYSIQPKGTDQP